MAEYSTSDFDYEFPAAAIAQRPLPDRGGSRLLVLDRSSGAVTHRHFRDLPSLMRPGDVLVRNVSRVMRARLIGERDNGRPAEVLLVHPEAGNTWLAMVHPGGKLKTGRQVHFGSDATVHVVGVVGGGIRRIRFVGEASMDALMAKYGRVPLPPYIDRAPDASDAQRYQTVYASEDGSVAAPTAGLHFTQEILAALEHGGITIADVVLHVGPGTFKPVEVEDPSQHRMHAERYEIPEATAQAVNDALASKARVWAVGTTAVRTLEAAMGDEGLEPGGGWTALFIYPPFSFRVVDAMITNFHLPRSTLLMLVSAFAGHAHTMAAYHEAISAGYRLFSYGDAMAIL